MRVEVAYGTAERQTLVSVELAEGATVGQALQAVAAKEPFAELPLDSMPVGIFGRPANRDTRLKARDRVELYRPLALDPKEARRRRAES